MRGDIIKRLFRFSFIFLMVGLLSLGVKNISASNETGHNNFDIIEIPSDSKAMLLTNMSSKTKKAIQDKVKRIGWGWNTYVENYRVLVNYQARTIFARSNLTYETLTFNYNMSTGRTVTNSVSVTGSLSTEISAKIKSMTIGGSNSIKGTYENTVETTESEKINFSVNIHPRTKVSLIVKGTAELTNGAAKFYFFGLNYFKGNFEFIDVVTEYYELVEVAL